MTTPLHDVIYFQNLESPTPNESLTPHEVYIPRIVNMGFPWDKNDIIIALEANKKKFF